jgi:hypothetical protein
VRLLLRGRPDGLEVLDEFGARRGLDAHRADEFDRAGVHARDVRDVAHRRILHGDLGRVAARARARGRERVAEVRVELLPAEVDEAAARERVELLGLDAVDDLGRLALGRYEVEPAARGELVLVEQEDAVGERVAAAEVVEEPAGEPGPAQSLLDVGHAPRVRVAVLYVSHVKLLLKKSRQSSVVSFLSLLTTDN